MATIDTLSPARVYLPTLYHAHHRSSKPISLPPPKPSKSLNSARKLGTRLRFLHKSFTVLCRSGSGSRSGGGSKPTGEDFMTRVLKENPSQVEPRYLIGDKLYTRKEKENLGKEALNANVLENLAKKLNLKAQLKQESGEGRNEEGVYLKDMLRAYKGKLYVPEQIFGAELSEEEEFDRNLEVLPKMSFEEFQKAMNANKVKLLTRKEGAGVWLCREFIVELKEIPGDKSLHRTKWAMRLYGNQALALLEEYTGPLYEIERHTMSWVGKLQEYPHPVASSLSGRMMVALGMVTATMAAAAVVVGGFLAAAVFAVTSFIFATTVHVVWPIVKPFIKIFHDIVFGILEGVWDTLVDSFTGGFLSDFYLFFRFGGISASIRMLIPISIILGLMVLLMRFKLSTRSKNFERWDLWTGIDFAKSKAEARIDGSTGVMFADVAGIDEAVEELQELVTYLKNPELFDQLGIKPPHGVLLEGPPGCGKTLVAKSIAGEAGVPFYQMAGSEFVEILVGVGPARVRDLFKRAKINKPSVIFIDEIDALATVREGIYKNSTDDVHNADTQERESTLNQLLVELDGFDTGKGVIFLAATNRKDLLDPALLRPGRFDRKIRIRPPNTKGRLDILKIHAGKVKMSESVDLSTYAKNLPGWSGAKLAQLVQEAALVAVRKGHKSILPSDLDDAVDRLTIGPQRVGIELGHQGQCRRATTQLGVVMTSHILRRYENAKIECCARISIMPRGQTLSQVVFPRLDDEAYQYERRPQLLHRLQVFLGGRAAEEVIYGHDTSRASVNYLADASWLARKIITIWNLENKMVMHGEPPPWRKKMKFAGPRLDFEGSLYHDYGLIEPPINFDLDDEVAQRTEELIRDMYEKTVSLLRRHHAALLKAVKVLLNYKELRGEEIDYILNNYPPRTPLSRLLEEKDVETLPVIKREERELEYALLTQPQRENL